MVIAHCFEYFALNCRPIIKCYLQQSTISGQHKRVKHGAREGKLKLDHLIAKSVRTTKNLDIKSFLKNPVSQTIVLEPPQPIEVFNAINSVNLHKASRYDNISSFFVVREAKS